MDDIQSHQSSLEARWQEAQSRCKDKIGKSDRDIQRMLRFETPDELITELKRLQQEQSDTIVQRLVSQIYPCLFVVNGLFVLLVAIAPPVNIETRFFFGLLHLIIAGAIRSTDALSKLVDILNKIRQEMAYFQHCAKHVSNNRELQSSIIDSLVILMEFFVECESFFRRSPQERFISEGWPRLKSAFEIATSKLSDSVDNVNRHALLELSNIASNQALSNTNALAKLQLRDDDVSKFPCYSLPAKLSQLYGRDEVLKMMNEYLERPLDADELRAFVIHGLGGNGKSAIAQAYAHQCKSSGLFDAIFWIRSQTPEESFLEIARKLNFASEEGARDTEALMLRILNWLSTTEKTWLLIYDNVEEPELLKKSLPNGNGRILVTTRYKWLAWQIKGSRIHELGPLSDDDGLEMFESICATREPAIDRTTERSQTRRLVKELGGLPLAIEQIAGYVSYRSISMEKFQHMYDRSFHRIYASGEASSADKTLATVWEVQFTAIVNTPASRVLGLLSLLSPDTIPMDLFIPDDAFSEEILDIIGYSEDEIEDAIDVLRRLCLVKSSDATISLHRLVQKAFLQRAVGTNLNDLQSLFDLASKLLNYRFPKSDTRMSHWGKWEVCAKYLPHVLSITQTYERQYHFGRTPLHMCEELLRLIRNCAWFNYERGSHKECLDLVEIAKHGCSDKTGLEYAYLCSHAACALYELHEVPEGTALIDQALEIRKRLLDSNDPQLANTFNNKGLLELSKCNYDTALKNFQAALVIRRKLRNNYVPASHVLLGLTHVLLGDFEEAEAELKQCETLCEEAGSKLELLSTILRFWQGNLALQRGQVEKSKGFFNQGHTILERLAPTYIAVSAFEYKLGYVDFKLGEIESAINHFNESIAIASFREIEGEKARALRMKAVVLQSKTTMTDVERAECEDAALQSKGILHKYLQEIGRDIEGLTEDQQYDLLICGQRR